jgi:hypothetical protein
MSIYENVAGEFEELKMSIPALPAECLAGAREFLTLALHRH